VQTFYQPLFSIFPLAILFPSKSFLHQKAQSKSFFPKAKAKSPAKAQKAKSQAKVPLPPSGVFYKPQRTWWSREGA
jgi:hypothetical protein